MFLGKRPFLAHTAFLVTVVSAAIAASAGPGLSDRSAVSAAGTVQAAALQPDGAPAQQVAALTDGDRGAGSAKHSERPTSLSRSIVIGKGDTLLKVLLEAGAEASDSHELLQVLRKVYDPRDLRPDDMLALDLKRDKAPKSPWQIRKLALTVKGAYDFSVQRTEKDSFEAYKIRKERHRSLKRAQGTIENSLYVAGRKAGLTPQFLVQLIKIYSWDVDFQRDIQPGDEFEVLYEKFTDKDGKTVGYGDILHANLTISGIPHPVYRYEVAKGRYDYFDDKGRSVRKAMLRTPLDGARISSRYGKRRHPVLGYTRMHRGVDFAAPRGTPIYAAGNGRIEVRGRNGAYGNYIRIRHNATYATAYGHMRRFAKGLHRGSRVKQGQVIGYVGTTGRSTGPHLHYEVLVRHHQVNPLSIKLPSGESLDGRDLKRFKVVRDEMRDQLATLTPKTTVTQR